MRRPSSRHLRKEERRNETLREPVDWVGAVDRRGFWHEVAGGIRDVGFPAVGSGRTRACALGYRGSALVLDRRNAGDRRGVGRLRLSHRPPAQPGAGLLRYPQRPPARRFAARLYGGVGRPAVEAHSGGPKGAGRDPRGARFGGGNRRLGLAAGQPQSAHDRIAIRGYAADSGHGVKLYQDRRPTSASQAERGAAEGGTAAAQSAVRRRGGADRKSTRLNSS